jgi:hypothetical protein
VFCLLTLTCLLLPPVPYIWRNPVFHFGHNIWRSGGYREPLISLELISLYVVKCMASNEACMQLATKRCMHAPIHLGWEKYGGQLISTGESSRLVARLLPLDTELMRSACFGRVSWSLKFGSWHQIYRTGGSILYNCLERKLPLLSKASTGYWSLSVW